MGYVQTFRRILELKSALNLDIIFMEYWFFALFFSSAHGAFVATVLLFVDRKIGERAFHQKNHVWILFLSFQKNPSFRSLSSFSLPPFSFVSRLQVIYIERMSFKLPGNRPAQLRTR